MAHEDEMTAGASGYGTWASWGQGHGTGSAAACWSTDLITRLGLIQLAAQHSRAELGRGLRARRQVASNALPGSCNAMSGFLASCGYLYVAMALRLVKW